MGRAKAEWEERQGRGWSAVDKYVCERCVEDEFLKQVIRSGVTSKKCDYCGRRSRRTISSPVTLLMPVVYDTIRYFHEDPDRAGLPWDEGAFIIEPIPTQLVLLFLDFDCHADLFADVAQAFENADWVQAAGGHWCSSHVHEQLRDSWHSFVHAVKHETRFHFRSMNVSPVAGPQELAPGKVLAAIGQVVRRLKLIQTLPANTPVYRARVREDPTAWLPDLSTMGAPPAELSRAGRMNPPGISYFYSAMDQGTAVAETVSSPPVEVVLAAFTTARPITILNLCDLPDLPSVFDASRRLDYEWIKFLDGFVAEISKPVRKDGREHIDYVPSQVVCEWFALIFRPRGRKSRLDGLLYPSAVSSGGRNLVLFPTSRGYDRAFDSIEYVSATTRELPDWGAMTSAIIERAS